MTNGEAPATPAEEPQITILHCVDCDEVIGVSTKPNQVVDSVYCTDCAEAHGYEMEEDDEEEIIEDEEEEEEK